MTMKLNRAFNSRMMYKLIKYDVEGGYYDSDNNWIEGTQIAKVFYGRVVAGNKFSQFDEGIAKQLMEGGERFSDFRSLYVPDRWPRLEEGDKVDFKGTYYNVLQESDESIFGFHSYILEKSKNWSPQ